MNFLIGQKLVEQKEFGKALEIFLKLKIVLIKITKFYFILD